MIRGIKLFNTKSIGIATSLPLNRVQTRTFINSTSKSFSIINNNNNNNIYKNKITTKRSYSTDSNNNSNNNTTEVITNVTNELNNNSNNITNTVAASTQKYPDYVKVETMTPDEPSSISEWFTNFKFENIDFLNGLHDHYGLPWVAIVAGMAISLRALTFPVTVRTQKIGAKMKLVRKEVEKHGYLNDGTTEGRLKMMNLQQQIMAKNGVSTFSALGPNLILLPLLVYPFLIIRQISDHTNILDNIPFLWVDSLSAADPYYLLPLCSSAFQILSSRISMTPDTHPIMKGFMYSLGVLPLLFTINFSAALNVYWCTNSILFCLTNMFFKSKFGAKLFNLPYDDPTAIKTSNIVIAPEQFTQVKTIEENKDSNEKKEKLQEQIKAKNDLIEQRKEELKAFRRKKN